MNKFTLLTFNSYKEELLKALQRFENVHFRDLQKNIYEMDSGESFQKVTYLENVSALEGELAKIKFTMEKTKPFAQIPKGLKAMTVPRETISYDEFDGYADSYDYSSVYADVRASDERLKSLKTEKERAKNDNQNLNSWIKLDASIEAIEGLKSITHFIGSINRSTADSFLQTVESEFDCSYVEFIGGAKDEITALVIAPQSDQAGLSELLKNIGFTRQNLNFRGVPSELIRANNSRITEIEKKEAEISKSMEKYGAEYPRLQISLDYYNTALARAVACENFLRMDNVIVIEGWAPTEESPILTKLLNEVCGDDYYLEESPGEKENDETPVKLKNNKLVSAFEDVTLMYSTPKYNEIDPTPVLTPFYMMFFGLMLGDAGFGLLILLGTAFALKKMTLGKGTRNFVRFLNYLSYPVIAAGILYGSFFAYPFFTPIRTETGWKAILDTQLDIQLMLVLSIGIGVFHVLFGVGVKGYMLIRDGKPLDAIFDSLFFITAILGGMGWILGFAGILPDFAVQIAKWVFGLSLIGLAATQGRESPSLGGKIGSGLYSVYGLTSYVGDIISYTRIVALGLSGAYIGYSFNLMAGLMPNLVTKIIFSTLIFIIGQALNLGLAVLGAYVHTCRLQYVEFFGKFYEGGGKAFKPLAMKNEAVDIKIK